MNCGLLRSAVVGKSIKQSHWNRVFCKCCFLYSANHSSLGFYSEKQLAETVWPLQIVRSCTAVSLLCAADDSGIRKPLERRCSQLHAVGNVLPDRVYALRWILGGSDFQRIPVYIHRKG